MPERSLQDKKLFVKFRKILSFMTRGYYPPAQKPSWIRAGWCERSSLNLYSRGVRFKSLSGHRSSLMKSSWFSSGPQRKFRDSLSLSAWALPSKNFQLIIHQSSHQSTLYSLRYERHKLKHKTNLEDYPLLAASTTAYSTYLQLPSKSGVCLLSLPTMFLARCSETHCQLYPHNLAPRHSINYILFVTLLLDTRQLYSLQHVTHKHTLSYIPASTLLTKTCQLCTLQNFAHKNCHRQHLFSRT
jgi:hypothetical protein